MTDLLTYIELINKKRVSSGTNMNKAKAGHGGSSRSHCAIILTLMKHNIETGDYNRTQFHLVDLAGAERPDKVGKRVSAYEAMVALYKGEKLDPGH